MPVIAGGQKRVNFISLQWTETRQWQNELPTFEILAQLVAYMTSQRVDRSSQVGSNVLR